MPSPPKNIPSRAIGDDDIEGGSPLARTTSNSHSLAGSYRRPSFFTMGGPRGTVVPHTHEADNLTNAERVRAREEERALLEDNAILSGSPNANRRTLKSSTNHEAAVFTTGPTEATSLLESAQPAANGADGAIDSAADSIDQKWEDAVMAGLIQTSWARESKVLVEYSAPLILTFILQYSLTVASIFTVGHLGKVELAAVSLASMTANISGYAVYQGLATSLDTLCAQAYGSGNKKLVGLQTQRMVCFLWVMSIPISVLWFFADHVLKAIIPDKEVASLAGLYLKVAIIGAPGYALFEATKRYVQAQGLFSASLYVLLIGAPINAFLNWCFVWKFGWGFVGAPIAVVVTDNLLPALLFIYIYYFAGRECWNGFSYRAFENWGPMVRLALPGFLMMEAEVLAFEILTLAAAYLGTTTLAAQSVLANIAGIMFQIPFPLSIAGSTRIANLIGASLTDAARVAAKVNMAAAIVVGIINVILLSTLRFYIPALFTSDEDVIEIIAAVLPLCASFQLFDAFATNCNGILRGLGRQSIGGYTQLFCYYVVALPISMGTAFGLGWGLWGLWGGVAVGLFLVGLVESIFLTQTDWERSVIEAQKRNEEV
ncbi:multidrug and toxin extrusion protein 2 [Arthroderma uncinatum]|uniref:multidrug and toxin extrusion protein 2 n=1 Tax=Arthroderma uncinatum TaxID=74035 RepID=UPI00144A9B07|nr:multidrug and toxin extrusion protein 2 [Arthroderma uncinatum]KAF3482167.1 multidrug and toxin extrusion protein 2 [Arthroderma uncinatum]